MFIRANVKAGTAAALFAGSDLGGIKGDIAVALGEETFPITVDELGSTPIGDYIIGRTVEVTVPLTESQIAQYPNVIPAAVLVSDTTKRLVNVVPNIGHDKFDDTDALILKPFVDGAATTDANEWFTVFKAVPTGVLAWTYGLQQQRVLPVVYRGYADVDNSNRLYAFGDITASADVTPPAAPTPTPANDATGIAIAVTPSLLFAEAMQTVTAAQAGALMTLIDVVTSDVVPSTVAVTQTTSANDTWTLTPDAVLTNSQDYIIMASSNIKDAAGNALAAAFTSVFTTTA